jgi:starch-binding outer membrane protein, SusD/RagB family
MKQYQIFTFHTMFFLLLSITIASCKKMIEIEKPQDLITTDAIFTDDKTATSSVVGIFSRMMQNRLYFASGAMTLYPGMTADEFYSSSPNAGRDVFKNNNLLAGDNIIRNNIWRFGYFHIYQANACLEGLENANRITPAYRSQLTGEAKFIRAFCYFYLVNVFGDVPLITNTDYKTNSTLARASANKVYELIVQDLKEAQEMLPNRSAAAEKVRPGKWAATALLARTYLYMGDWVNAEAQATAIIDANYYSLVPDLNTVFLANSSEAIWQLMPVITNSTGNNTHEGFLFVAACAACRPDIRLTRYLLNSFETNDKRKAAWVAVKTINGEDYYSPLKYKVRSNYPSAATEYYMVLRLAEQYLIRAEARAQQDKVQGAQDDLNIIRARAGLSGTTANDKASLLAAIEHERQIELFAEWGHRWFDLKRTGRADAVLGVEKGANWQSTDALYPIPFEEIKINPALTQNPGY